MRLWRHIIFWLAFRCALVVFVVAQRPPSEVEQAAVERLRALLTVQHGAAQELRLSKHLRGPAEYARLAQVRAALGGGRPFRIWSNIPETEKSKFSSKTTYVFRY